MKKIEQVVILAAGEGTRLWPISENRPKVLAPVLGKTLLELKLESLRPLAKEVVLVVGAQKDIIKSLFKKNYKGLKIKYVEQKTRLGTGHALKSAKDVLKSRFLVMNGDDIYGAADIQQCLNKFPCILVKKVKDISQFGAVLTKNNKVKDLVEKPKEQISDIANIGAYFLPKSVLKTKIQKSERKEYEITDYVKALAKTNPLYFVKAKTWFPVSSPQDVLNINRFFLTKKGSAIKTKLGSDVLIKGPVFIGKNVQARGKAKIGPFAVLRRGCKIGEGVVIQNSIIGEKVRIGPGSQIQNSIICENSIVCSNLFNIGD